MKPTPLAIITTALYSFLTGTTTVAIAATATPQPSTPNTAAETTGLSTTIKTVNIQISPVSMAFREHYNLTAIFRVADKWFLGAHGVYRPDSYVEGHEVGLRTAHILHEFSPQGWLLAKGGMSYFNLSRPEPTTHHEGGMFTPFYDAHTSVGTYRGIMFELGASTLVQVYDRFNLELGAGLEMYGKPFYFTDNSVNRVLPVVEINLGLAI